jgi:hypothetical protein
MELRMTTSVRRQAVRACLPISPARHGLAERPRLRVGNGRRRWADRRGKMSGHRGVDPIGLGQLAVAAGWSAWPAERTP